MLPHRVSQSVVRGINLNNANTWLMKTTKPNQSIAKTRQFSLQKTIQNNLFKSCEVKAISFSVTRTQISKIIQTRSFHQSCFLLAQQQTQPTQNTTQSSPNTDTSRKIPETSAARDACLANLDSPDLINSQKVLCVCPGDGRLAMMGTRMVLATKWPKVISIAPDYVFGGPKETLFDGRLVCIKDKVENVDMFEGNWDLVVVMHAYSPASLQHIYDKLPSKQKYMIVSVPCVAPELIPGIQGLPPTKEFEDPRIRCEWQTVRIWKGIKA